MFEKNIAVIPARGGSIRLPNKNIKLLGEKPLIEHTINYAKKVGFKSIVVSTDNKEIKEISNNLGVDVVDRPDYLSTNTSPTIDAIRHVLKIVKSDYEYVVLLQPTNPLRPINLVKNGFDKIMKGNYDSLMTVTRTYRKFGKITDDRFTPFNYEIGQRSQDLEPLYYENGLLYISKTNLILKGKLIGEKSYSLIVDHPYASVDIDTQEDFDYAEFMLNKAL